MVVQKELAPLLAKQGFTVVAVGPSTPAPMPQTTLPPDADSLATPDKTETRRAQTAEAADAQFKASELAREGKLPQLKLRSYSTPKRDADLPQSVRTITPPDVTTALFALSQQKGVPVLRGGVSIPGRLPDELKTSDPKAAEYAMVVRFAVVQPLGMGSFRKPLPVLAEQRGVLVAAVGGVGALGFGAPAAPSSGRTNYGTPGGYVRGYEGSSPNDFWHRDSDFFSRDYQMNNSPPSPIATPPSGLSPSPGGTVRAMPRGGSRASGGMAGWYLLEMDCYDLAPSREGKAPKLLWQANTQRAETQTGLIAALPQMIQAVFANSGQ